MRKDYLSLDIICKRKNVPDEKLIFKDGKYSTKVYTNRTFMANEGPLSSIERHSVNLLNWSDIDGITLPNDVYGFELVLNSKSLLSSVHTSVICTNESKKILSFDNFDNFSEFSLSEILRKYIKNTLNLFNQNEKENKLIRK